MKYFKQMTITNIFMMCRSKTNYKNEETTPGVFLFKFNCF